MIAVAGSLSVLSNSVKYIFHEGLNLEAYTNRLKSLLPAVRGVDRSLTPRKVW